MSSISWVPALTFSCPLPLKGDLGGVWAGEPVLECPSRAIGLDAIAPLLWAHIRMLPALHWVANVF